MTREPDPLVIRLPRQQGQKEVRFAHLLSGEVAIETQVMERAVSSSHRASSADRVSKLENDVETLKSEFEKLREQFEGFKKQFE
jgi:uncharacterized protein YceH (UPF0502 family)